MKKILSILFLFLISELICVIGCSKSTTHSGSKAVKSASVQPWFIDMASRAGVDFRHVNGASGRLYYPEINGSGCAFLDADGDGWQDIFLVNASSLPGFPHTAKSTCALYLNNHDGTFRNVTAGSGLDISFYGTGCAIGDYDNDGLPDIYVASALGSGHLFHNLGKGKFEDVTKRSGTGNEGHWGTACVWLDYDRDGKLDLFVGNYIKYKLGSDTPCQLAEGYRSYCGPQWFQPDTPRLFRNLGNGRFQDVSKETGLSSLKEKCLAVGVLDFNNDGWPDLFVTNDVWPQHLLENAAVGKHRGFREVGTEAGISYQENGGSIAGMGVDIADLLNDGRLWIATSNFSSKGIAVFRQESDRLFSLVSEQVGVSQPSHSLLGFGLSWIDTDNSGIKALLTVNGHVHPDIHTHEPPLTYEEPKLLLEWDGSNRFRDVTVQGGEALTRPTVGRGLAIGDYDNDGRLDALVNNLAAPAQLLHNQRANPYHWLGIKLKGRKSNRDGFGSAVIIKSSGRTYRDYCRGGGSYGSQSDSRLHFGLGSSNKADRITIRWPSGTTDVIQNVLADHYYLVVEGSSTAARQ